MYRAQCLANGEMGRRPNHNHRISNKYCRIIKLTSDSISVVSMVTLIHMFNSSMRHEKHLLIIHYVFIKKNFKIGNPLKIDPQEKNEFTV